MPPRSTLDHDRTPTKPRAPGPGAGLAVGAAGALTAAVALIAIILIASDETPPRWLFAVFLLGLMAAVAGFAWAIGSLLGRPGGTD